MDQPTENELTRSEYFVVGANVSDVMDIPEPRPIHVGPKFPVDELEEVIVNGDYFAAGMRLQNVIIQTC